MVAQGIGGQRDWIISSHVGHPDTRGVSPGPPKIPCSDFCPPPVNLQGDLYWRLSRHTAKKYIAHV